MYTVAGITLVATAAGVFYYASDSRRAVADGEGAAGKRKSKKDRRKAKKDAEDASGREGVSGEAVPSGSPGCRVGGPRLTLHRRQEGLGLCCI